MNLDPYIGYYREANIIPVRQNIEDLGAHFRRRRALYRMLGLAPALLKGKSVLEIGPGSGDNAVYTQSLQPDRYVLVDANPSSIELIRRKLQHGVLDPSIVEVIEGNLLDFVPDQQFDILLCEGLLPGQKNPAQCLARMAKFVTPGGVIAITNMTSYSILAEICRRAVRPFFEARYPNDKSLLSALVQHFSPDLDALGFTSRRYDDWVHDTILHPWQKDMSFSIEDAIRCLDADFDFYGSSPQFFADTRWYKAFASPDITVNVLALSQYELHKPLLLDYRVDHIDQKIDSVALDGLVAEAIDLHCSIWSGETYLLESFLQRIVSIAVLIEHSLPKTAVSLRDYTTGMSELARGNAKPNFGSFSGFFGRGQQYSSFVRYE